MSKKSNANNRSNQMNPNNQAYWSSRGQERGGSSGSAGTASPKESGDDSTPPVKQD